MGGVSAENATTIDHLMSIGGTIGGARLAMNAAFSSFPQTLKSAGQIAVQEVKCLTNGGMQKVATKVGNVIYVNPQGVAIPPQVKYQIPNHYIENIKRMGSYGEYVNGKFVEKLRIDPATAPGTKGPNYSHYHLNGTSTHYSPHAGTPNPRFNQ
ncbi:MAG: hypothetical protein ACH350_10150 [Parachlamydiaceae bacterium]